MSFQIERWVLSLLAVFGAFFLSGIGGALIADLLGIWDIPVAGFLAAFAVVSVAHLSAPARPKAYVFAIFLIGALVALLLLDSQFYPESYEGKAYQPSWLPYIATLSGGLVALVIVWFPYRSQTHN